ncbi:hypothetical protein SADUNF_Sadunf11G0012900 [Salix dunnii]|uniref:Uncharacterized protein n=1 Tax=Salix dunnii TaxID=1413687 RepID=A0A835MNN2_9ROSI|nr:hypothetical protein SADUNF_Sadunf11G0012900 [Salix dunnii]
MNLSGVSYLADGVLMEIPSASFASSKYTKMPSTVTPVLIQKQVLMLLLVMKEFVLCAVSKYLTPSFINKAIYSSTQMLSGSSGLGVTTDRLGTASLLICLDYQACLCVIGAVNITDSHVIY